MSALIRSSAMYDTTLTEQNAAGGPYRDRTCDLGIKSHNQAQIHQCSRAFVYVKGSPRKRMVKRFVGPPQCSSMFTDIHSCLQKSREYSGNGENDKLKCSQLLPICCAFVFFDTSTPYVCSFAGGICSFSSRLDQTNSQTTYSYSNTSIYKYTCLHLNLQRQ